MKPDAIMNQISAINRLHMVHFYHLLSADSPVSGILAYYQDQTINLTNTDTHFATLIQRLADVYAVEAPSAEILADELTATVLKKATASDELYKEMLEGYTPVKYPMIAPKAFSHIYILPIVRHILSILYGSLGEELNFAPRHKHWFGRGILDAGKGTHKLHFPYRLLEHTPLSYELTLGNVMSAGNSLNIYITLDRNKLTASCRDLFYGYEGNITYSLSKDKAELSQSFTKKNEVLTDSTDSYTALAKEAPAERILKLTDTACEDWSALTSPWGSRCFIASKAGTEYRVFCSSENGMTVSHCMCFRYLTSDETCTPAFGLFSFRLYEHEDTTELHFLSQASPESGLYAAQYAGRCYTI